MYRPILLASILIACSFAKAQNQPSINYTTPAIRLESALGEISKQAGKKLTVSDELAAEPIVLRLNAVPLQDVLDKLANEFVAEWKPTKEGLELTRTQEVVDAFQKRVDADRLAAFQKSIDDLMPIANSKLMDDNEAQQIAIVYTKMLADEKAGNGANGDNLRFTLQKRTADMRLYAQILSLIGAQRLASLSLGSHIFSPEPTPMELPIEGLDPQLVDQYIQQKNLLSKAVNERWPKDMWDGYGDSAMFYARNAVKAPVRIFLQFQADPKTDGGWANLTVIDSEGKSVGNYGGGLGNSFDPQKYSIARAKVNASSVKEAGITLSPVETQLMDRYSNVAKKPTAPSQAVVDLLTSPEQHDPFTIFFSTILLADAANENRNLIASGADLDWRFARATNGLVKPSVYELSLGRFRRATIDRPDGWLVVRSMNPINASDTRLARQALGNFTRAWAEKGYDSIEDWAELATHVKPRDIGYLGLTYWQLLRGQQGLNYENDWDALRLYGYLSDAQLSALGSGQSLDYHTLTAEEQSSLERMVYESYQLRKTNNSALKGSSFVSSEDGLSPYAEGADAYAQESVPNGIPPNAQLSARTDKRNVIFIREGMDISSFEREEDIKQLASELVWQERPESKGPDQYRIQSVRLGSKRTITFTLTLNDKVQMESQLREDQYATGDAITVDQLKDKLPPDIWQKLDEEMQHAREAQKNIKFGPPPQDNTPPPPPLRY